MFFSITLLMMLNVSFAQNLNDNWKQDLSASLEEFLKCTNTNAGSSECKQFTGNSLSTVYTINDFYSEKLGRSLFVNEISDLLNTDKWTLLGKAYDQKALSEAQTLSNAKKAVVAVYRDIEGVGLHVAIILPGELVASGSWGFKVPNSASFFTSTPEKSFVSKGLSYAFSKNQIKNIELYSRNY